MKQRLNERLIEAYSTGAAIRQEGSHQQIAAAHAITARIGAAIAEVRTEHDLEKLKFWVAQIESTLHRHLFYKPPCPGEQEQKESHDRHD